MYINIWTVLILCMVLYTTGFCVKKEYFEEPSLKVIRPKGTKYTIVDVNRAVDIIKDYFYAKEKAHLNVTQILSVTNGPSYMTLKLFMYNPDKNILNGNTVKVQLPVGSKSSGSVISAQRFTDSDDAVEYDSNSMYQKIDLQSSRFL